MKAVLGEILKAMFEIRLTPQAERAYIHLDASMQRRIDKVFEQFEQGKFQHKNIRALRGKFTGSLRYRLGKWRIIFTINSPKKIVCIEVITTRGGAYR